MRLPVDAGFRLFALGLTTATLAGCGLVGGKDRPASFADAGSQVARDPTGPGADYPVVLGEPFTADGQTFTPADTLNYDVVGYAALDDGAGVSIAHRTLPLPSYVEVTSLATGKTILARVERRGPLSGSQFIALSGAAAQRLEATDGVAVRVRRVNPPEKDRFELRSGRAAADRIDTPRSLVEVLRRKLPASGAASLRAGVPAKPSVAAISNEMPKVAAVAPSVAMAPAPQKAVTAYPLPPLKAGPAPVVKPVTVAEAQPAPVKFDLASTAKKEPPATKRPEPAVAAASGEGFVIQAGAFSSQANAQRAAKVLGGYVSPKGKLFLVRTGPFNSRGQAEAALAKVRAAGYSDARVFTAG